MANEYLPIGMSLENRKCLIIGAGSVALRKIENLMDYDADITVISPEIDKKIQFFADQNQIKLIKREYQSPEAGEYGLVISATNNESVNEIVFKDCQAKKIPVNVVDNPKFCDFLFPAVVKRGSLSISVTTDSKAPFLSGHLRLILDGMFDEKWNKIAKYAEEFRKKVMARYPDSRTNKVKSFENFLNADWKTLLEKEKKKEINIENEMDNFMNPEMILEFGPDQPEDEGKGKDAES